MTLSLYRRHRRDCKAGHPEEFHSGEFEERKKGWKRCACPIFASGTLAGRSRRQGTGRWEWDDAKAIAAAWEQAGVWDGTPPPAVPIPDEPAKPQRIAIADAVRVFLMNRKGAKIAAATLRKYRTFTKQLTDFSEKRGYVMLDQFTSADIDVFYSGWNLGARAKGKRLGTLRAFFRFCMNREWLSKNPVSADMKPPMGANRVANKAPYTDEELQRIIDACDQFGSVKWSNDVKGGAKLDHRGGEKVDHFLGSWGFGMRDLRGRLERRPAAPAGRRV